MLKVFLLFRIFLHCFCRSNSGGLRVPETAGCLSFVNSTNIIITCGPSCFEQHFRQTIHLSSMLSPAVRCEPGIQALKNVKIGLNGSRTTFSGTFTH